MAIEKYIIDKSDLTALLRGECLAIQPKGQIKGFCVEIAGNLTNGDMIKAMFPNGDLHDYDYYDGYVIYEINYADCKFDKTWWNAPYKAESAEISKIKSEYLVMDEYGYTDKELVQTVNMLIDKVNELNALIQHKSRE